MIGAIMELVTGVTATRILLEAVTGINRIIQVLVGLVVTGVMQISAQVSNFLSNNPILKS